MGFVNFCYLNVFLPLSKLRRVRLVLVFCLLLSVQQVLAAIGMNIVSSSRVFLTPGIDLVRQNIATVILDADQAYTVQINDNNGGAMTMGYHLIPYRVSYNNSFDMRLSRNPTVVESAASVTNGSRSIAITILGADTAKAAAGDYRSTITVTITAF